MLDVGFIGHVEAGERLPLGLLCKGSEMQTTAPLAAPIYKIYGARPAASGSGMMEMATGTLSDSDTGSILGFRTGHVDIDYKFGAGSVYIVVFSYSDSSGTYGAMGSFEVV